MVVPFIILNLICSLMREIDKILNILQATAGYSKGDILHVSATYSLAE